MTPKQIEYWLRCWQDTGAVAVHEIKAYSDVKLARKYCQCMRVAFEKVSDRKVWNAVWRLRQQGAI